MKLEWDLTGSARNPLREQKLLRPQLLNRISQLRRLFKLKLLRGFAHITFQFFNVGIHLLLRGELGDAFAFAGGQVRVIGRDNSEPASCPGDAQLIPA